jgi:hypothetical protein
MKMSGQLQSPADSPLVIHWVGGPVVPERQAEE